jgi:hypothetical protein
VKKDYALLVVQFNLSFSERIQTNTVNRCPYRDTMLAYLLNILTPPLQKTSSDQHDPEDISKNVGLCVIF